MRRAVQAGTVTYGVLLLLCLAYLVPKFHLARREGWRAEWRSGALLITSAESWSGLRPGDQVLAFNGDIRIQTAGPATYVRNYPAGIPYRLRVRRGEAILEPALRIASVRSWVVEQNSFLIVVSILCCIMSTWIGMQDPASRMVRIAWLSGMMAALQMMAYGLEAGTAGGWPAGVAGYAVCWVAPWKLYVTYLFAAALPTGAAETGGWRRLQQFLFLLAAAIAIDSLPYSLAHLAVPGEAGIRVAQIAARMPRVDGLWNFGVLVFSAATIAAVIRNYRRLTSEDGRRRVRWVVFGVSTSAGCLVLAEILVGFRLAPGILLNWAQLPLVLIPLTLGYAIAKHRVLGIVVVVRRGLQYLLARRSIEGAVLLLPGVVLVRGIVHPEMTLRQLIDPPAVYGGSLAAACLLFLTRRRLLDALDRRFFREAWDRERLLAGLVGTIRRQFSFQDTVTIVCRRIEEALHPEFVDVLYRPKRNAPVQSAAGQAAEARAAELQLPIPSHDDGAAGVLLLGPKKSEEPYTARDIELLRVIVEHLGLAHANHLLVVERAEAVLEERSRMARELHDTLAQGFAGISLHLEAARLALASEATEVERHLEQARQLARSSLVEARRSVHDLRETVRQATDLRRQLLELADRLSAGSAVAVQVETHGDTALPEAMGRNLFRIAQESVTNALKHSGATRIRVIVEFGTTGVRLRVRDNGRGFDPARAGSGGYGLTGMRERAAEIQGALEVRSSAGGTEVCAFAQFA